MKPTDKPTTEDELQAQRVTAAMGELSFDYHRQLTVADEGDRIAGKHDLSSLAV